MIFSREWAMPNNRTFQIKPIKNIIAKYKMLFNPKATIIDPFANSCHEASITNDLDPHCDCLYHLDALDFLKMFAPNSVDMVLYDPPYSPRQVSECYRQFGKTVNMQTTQASYWSKQKNEISRVLKPNGIVISCGWNSNGVGKKRGFEILELLLVSHGGNHNDTIVVVERKK